MRTKLTPCALAAMLAPTALGGLAEAQTFSSEDLTRRTVERRTVEAVNWTMPAVNYDLMFQAMIRAAKGTPNQIVY